MLPASNRPDEAVVVVVTGCFETAPPGNAPVAQAATKYVGIPDAPHSHSSAWLLRVFSGQVLAGNSGYVPK